MDQDSLVERQIDDGARIVEALREASFDVFAAWWMKTVEEDLWFLYVASKTVDGKGIGAAYGDVLKVIHGLGPLTVDRFQVKLVSPDDPVARDIASIQNRSPARIPTRYSGKRLGTVAVDGAYIYPQTVTA